MTPVFGQYGRAVVLPVALAVALTRQDELREADEGAARRVHRGHRVQRVAALRDRLGGGHDPLDVPDHGPVVGVAHRHVVHRPARRGVVPRESGRYDARPIGQVVARTGLFEDPGEVVRVDSGEFEPGVRQRQHPAEAACREERAAGGALFGLRDDRAAPLGACRADRRVEQRGPDALPPLGRVHGDVQLGQMRLPLLGEQPQEGGTEGDAVSPGRQPGQTVARRGGGGIDERGDARGQGCSGAGRRANGEARRR